MATTRFQRKILDSKKEGLADAAAEIERRAAHEEDTGFAKRAMGRVLDRADATAAEIRRLAKGGDSQ